MKVHRYTSIGLVCLLLAAPVGCRAPAVAPVPAVPALPTSATAGGTSIVAIAPPAQACCPKQTLPQFLGITGLAGGLHDICSRIRNRLGSIWPGLEAKPEVLAISDPANLESPNPAVAEAAAVKAEEDAAAQKAKAIAYLATVGCAGCYPGIEDALLAALDDCTELVRFETAKALRGTAQMPCKNCCNSACCGPKIREKLEKIAYDTDSRGCFLEPSDRVRRMARLALAQCTCVPLKPEAGQQPGLPLEGPGPEDEPVPPPAPPPAAETVVTAAPTSNPATMRLPPIANVDGSAVVATPAAPQVRPVNYEEVLSAYRRPTASAPQAVEVAYECFTAPAGTFASHADALAAMTLVRAQLMSAQPGAPPPAAVARTASGWVDPARIRSQAIGRALQSVPPGGVSTVFEDAAGWHVVRVLDRRAASPTPASPPAANATSQPAPRAAVSVRLPPCDCR